jgi:hypothetical protein
MEQRAGGDDAATVPAKVSETGVAVLHGLPSTVSGFAQAIVKLRDVYAPNVTLAYHVSVWGTGIDLALSNPPDATVDALAARAAAFYKSLNARFDLAFAEFSDRDSGFYQFVYGDGGASWWDADDFRRSTRFPGPGRCRRGRHRSRPPTCASFVDWRCSLSRAAPSERTAATAALTRSRRPAC